MSPSPRLHHHDIMTIVGLITSKFIYYIVGLFTYRQYVIYIYIPFVRRVVLQLGLWLGLGPGNGIFPFFLFFCV